MAGRKGEEETDLATKPLEKGLTAKKTGLFWGIAIVLAVILVSYELTGVTFARAEFLGGVLTFDGLFLAVTVFMLGQDSVLKVAKQNSVTTIVVMILIMVSAGSSTFALLKLGELPDKSGLATSVSYTAFQGVASVIDLGSITIAIIAWLELLAIEVYQRIS